MLTNPLHAGSRAVADLLRSLLLQRDDYRARWRRFERRGPASGLNQAAIAQVIALHLWESGERPDSHHQLPRALKDRVRRALSGEIISPETLNWFIDAFAMAPEDAARLRALRVNDWSDSAAGVVGSLRRPQYLPLPQRHRTISVFEHRMIGPAGRPIAHRTTRAIVACEDGVCSYPYRLVPGAREVHVRRGGKAAAARKFNGSSPIVEIVLTQPLNAGQITSLEYDVEFGTDGSAPPNEYRRVAHARADNVDIVVRFDQAKLPSRLWWAVWDDYRDGATLYEKPVMLDKEGTVHRFLPHLENAAVGFRWDW